MRKTSYDLLHAIMTSATRETADRPAPIDKNPCILVTHRTKPIHKYIIAEPQEVKRPRGRDAR